ncbi:separase NDAI_0G01210 [Naumovozyma dairenensis CBS 421]|uniref:separase n=1 Tax=Naumovozyma dairenensis (strain ATCC 10597 / BCRC 20456 / CBS 421 / NBRC 0211 / NRRL Y-12639) TaxID=1071378 RepID=G0WDN6_NAUDC|nr:hypothetical protein NDAI_0G01210 [Naumovozyma dairenensis CBS 421]CCD25897.2 hypothetical protein NDAI_0G01210 [Naumovozyma dairenensis CBS 421]
MSKTEDPLNEISRNGSSQAKINSFLTNSGKTNNRNHTSKPVHIYDLKQGKENWPIVISHDIEKNYNLITEFLKESNVQRHRIDQIHDIFTFMYSELVKSHLLRQLQTLSKQHLMLIVKLMNANELEYSQKEIFLLYNATNLIKIEDWEGILLADFNCNNRHYLSTLKILSLQLLLKKKLYVTYHETIIELFSHDDRYLLQDPKLKIHTIIKLVLNMFSVLPNYKILFGLKFLQYIKQFNLSFETYLKNMVQTTFEKQLLNYSVKSFHSCKYFLNSFYLKYSKYNTQLNKIMLRSLIPNVDNIVSNGLFLTELKRNSDFNISCCCFTHDQMNEFVTNVEKFINNKESIQNSAWLTTMNSIWKLVKNENFEKNKRILTIFDKLLNALNSNIIAYKNCENELIPLIETLIQFCNDIQESRRISNIINVLFNCSVVLKNYKFLEMAAKLEILKYLASDNQPDQWKMIATKFEKFISSTSNHEHKLALFSYIFNVYVLTDKFNLPMILDFCQTLFLRCFSRLKLTHFIQFKHCSELMLVIVYSNSSILTIPYQDWSILSQMLFFCINGNFELTPLDINNNSNKNQYLYHYEVLIKSAYILNIDMKRHSTNNLLLLTRSFIDKWILRLELSQYKERKDDISSFEVNFVKTLFQYLNFNNFHLLIIELASAIKNIPEYYPSLIMQTEKWLLESYIDLQFNNRIMDLTNNLVQLVQLDLQNAKLDKLLPFLKMKSSLFAWENNPTAFERLFIKELPTLRPDIFDTTNKSKLSSSQYVEVLLFNINVLNDASKLHMFQHDIASSVIENKKALKFATALIKKSDKLSQSSRLSLIKSLSTSFINLIEIFVQIGLAKDSDFYTKELSKVISELGEPSAVYACLRYLHTYYKLTEQESHATVTLQKANKTFDYINGEQDIQSLCMFLFDNNECNKIDQSLKLFFGDQIKETFLPQYWKLQMGEQIEEITCLKKFRAAHLINKLNNIYQHALKSLQEDPFFKGLFESILVIPGISQPNMIKKKAPTYKQLHLFHDNDGKNDPLTPVKRKLSLSIYDSPRSSNMTPKGKHMKQKFDKVAAIKNLKIIKEAIENLELQSLRHHELQKVSSLFSLSLTMLSSINDNLTLDKDFIRALTLADLPKRLPLYYDKILSTVNDGMYRTGNLLPFNPQSMLTSKVELLNDLDPLSFRSNSFTFNIITIDVCSITGNLLLSKIDPVTKKLNHLSIPLNRGNARDLDTLYLSFKDASMELQNIIEESNRSTSFEVTNLIKTKEQRKEWWDLRHELDGRLQTLLQNIEYSWFNGFKGIFDTTKINESAFKDFKEKFYEILHQNLPSRKQLGNPYMFLQIEDWILQAMLKLDPLDKQFLSQMEDLIYCILDILLFHGEENAYDEIDFSLLHIQLEEQIRRYQSKSLHTSNEIDHTFLIVSNSCHSFPWESLSFMKDLSITRVPSLQWLSSTLQKWNKDLFGGILVNERISMILNPYGDLNRTEERFRELFKNIATNRPSSKLLINEKPDENQFLDMLSNSNLFIYVGHGGGEQYIRAREIKKQDNVAPAFLLGCSSASMKYFGKLEPTGTVHSYLLGGSPMVVGNLWDVTDKDIDKFSQEVFEKVGFVEMNRSNSKPMNVARAVNESRDICHLKYLNGAAPVVFGLPLLFYLE